MEGILIDLPDYGNIFPHLHRDEDGNTHIYAPVLEHIPEENPIDYLLNPGIAPPQGPCNFAQLPRELGQLIDEAISERISEMAKNAIRRVETNSGSCQVL